jgi:hypothetical protein
MGAKSYSGIKDLDEGRRIDESQIERLCQFVDERYDCADFRVVTLLKTIYAYSECISLGVQNKIKKTLLDFKYWHDEPGDDSLCTWSENHQLIFHTCEYLAGYYYKDDMFSNSDMSGEAHINKARPKLLQWFEHKFKYGFIEWHSNTYYEEDIAPLALLIDYAKEEEIVMKAKMIMDLLLLDMAMYSFDGFFNVCSGRCYENQKKDGYHQDTLDIYHYAFGKKEYQFNYERISSVFVLCKNYEVPEVIKLIAHDKHPGVLKDSMGLDLNELKTELDMTNLDKGGAFVWQMEAFTNPETINLTMDMFNTYHLQKNDFLKDLKIINYKILRKLNLLPLLIKIINPTTQGVAIERNNSYTYKTKDYMLSTAMRYHPGKFGDQQHIWHAALPNNIHIFTTHPGVPFFDDKARNFSPSYWVGNGILPDSVQHENIHMSIYRLNGRKGFLERSRPKMTHAYFPKIKFDEVVEKPQGVFGKIGSSYVALLGANPIEFISEEEIVQKGDLTAWICELSSASEAGDFNQFIDRVISEVVNFKGKTLTYKGLELTYKKAFKVKGEGVETQYQRLETPYCNIKRKPDEINIVFNDHSLKLNLEKQIRELGRN